MADTVTVDVLVDGGKASAAPPLGSSLGPLKVNISQVVAEINQKTAPFKGMKVPVAVTVNTETKEFTLKIGTPPASELIKKELNIQSGSGEPNQYAVGTLAFEHVIKIARMKEDSLFNKDLKAAVKTILGSCRSMGVSVDGKSVLEITTDVDSGRYDTLLASGAIDVPEEKKALLAETQKKIDTKLKEIMKQKAVAKESADAKAAKKEAK